MCEVAQRLAGRPSEMGSGHATQCTTMPCHAPTRSLPQQFAAYRTSSGEKISHKIDIFIPPPGRN